MKHIHLRSSLAIYAGLTTFGLAPFAQAQQTTHITPTPAPAWDTQPDTWVGADGLNRALPTAAQVGPPRKDRTLGMFYFLTFDRGQSAVYDNTKILTAHPEALTDIHHPAWGPRNSSHYWGEPLLGYYASDDPSVLRKHAAMLTNAGVDVVVFDNSNAVTYDRARRVLCETWEAIRRAGGKTPQIAFLCPFSNAAGIGTATLRELYDTLYAPNRYADLWFRWNGKPLVLADPSYADAGALRSPGRTPTALSGGGSLGQSFVADRPFTAAGGEFPTWNTTDAAMTLTLRAEGPRGPILARQGFTTIHDNATLFAASPRPLPAGKYYLEMTESRGQVGWWGFSSSVYESGEAFLDGIPAGGDRTLHVRYADTPQPVTVVPDPTPMTPAQAQGEAQKLRDFFTFRTPIAPYNIPHPPPDQWAWLQIAPQAPQTDATGHAEEITVGVAQNYNATVDNTAPMSVDGAFGRSYHKGARDTRPDAVRYGFNFAEQWERALQVDPPFVFVTGWNEWTAGFMESWVRWTAPPPIFVDEFTEEFSRDIEPMRNRPSPDGTDRTGHKPPDRGHGDDYYYQMVAAARHYKGARSQPPVTRQTIQIDGGFAPWKTVNPEYRDALGDPVHRDYAGVTPSLHYRNQTGRNDIIAAKVCCDAANITFYVCTKDPITAPTGDSWMLLLLNTDADYQTGWLGYDYVLNRRVGAKTATLERHIGSANDYRWEKIAEVPYRRQGNEMMLAIPRRLLGIAPGASASTATIDFKWADSCLTATPTWEDFTLNGDAAPDDRFNYRARLDR